MESCTPQRPTSNTPCSSASAAEAKRGRAASRPVGHQTSREALEDREHQSELEVVVEVSQRLLRYRS